MNYLSVETLTKSFGDRALFSNLSFGLDKGHKTALIAPNGTGKTTLMRIISGKEEADSGAFSFRNGIRLGYLEQQPDLDDSLTIEQYIQQGNSSVLKIIQEYQLALDAHVENQNTETDNRLSSTSEQMNQENAWDYERRLTQLLDLFRIRDLSKSISVLSGGEKKRLALAMVLLDEPDFLIFDEPTNHLDIDMVEWLEKHLSQNNITLLMVTHDRYFLDRVCNHIIEISDEKLYHHKGNYEFYLTKKEEREEIEKVEVNKARLLMKQELQWLRTMPKARTTKSKSRIDAFDDIKDKATSLTEDPELQLKVKMPRIGGKILEVEKIDRSFGAKTIVKDFSYSFQKGERLGITGSNGSGKTSLLKLITGEDQPESGTIDIGETIVFGYYTQEGIKLEPKKRVIDVVKEIAEVVIVPDGGTVSASKFLEYFMFPPETQYKHIEKLSGGELRRLHLLTVLVKNPNFLILDEPTNDLDLISLNKLEEFLMGFKGCLILVSHDRYFLDKLSDHIFVFQGEGAIVDHYGTYSDYRKKHLDNKSTSKPKEDKPTAQANQVEPEIKKKLSYKEKLEYETLEKEIKQLEQLKIEKEALLLEYSEDYEKLNAVSSEITALVENIDAKTMRWMELDELGI